MPSKSNGSRGGTVVSGSIQGGTRRGNATRRAAQEVAVKKKLDRQSGTY